MTVYLDRLDDGFTTSLLEGSVELAAECEYDGQGQWKVTPTSGSLSSMGALERLLSWVL